MIVGYARVSTQGQNLARQEASLRAAGCTRIFKDKASGGDFDRPEWRALCTFVHAGDCVVVHDLSRMGRNADQLKTEWEQLVDRGVDLCVRNMPMLDTRRYREMAGVGKLIIQIVFALLAWQAEEERTRIRTAQREGIARAKQAGKYHGRPKRYTALATGSDRLVYEKVVQLLKTSEPIDRIARTVGISRPTVYRIRNEQAHTGLDEPLGDEPASQ
ncbi:MAG: recombinase family protein [Sporolactobacillus sp.]